MAKQKKINLVAADMGYGHQRAAYPLFDLSGREIITANNYPGILEWEVNYWQNSLNAYEKISRLKKIPILGLIGSYYFLNEARIESLGTKINFADYSIEAQERGEIRIINLLSDRSNTIKSNPHDGLLDILIKTKKGGETLLRAKNFSLINERYNLLLDGVVEVKTPNEVKVVSNRINVIVGKDRSFD
jgi:hypothetical protein